MLAPTVQDARRRLGLNRLLSDTEIREYSREVDAYLDDCRPLVEGVLVAAMMRDGINKVLIDVENPSDDHLADVEVKVTLPPWCTVIDPSRLGRNVLPRSSAVAVDRGRGVRRDSGPDARRRHVPALDL